MRNFTVEEMRRLQEVEAQLSNAALYGFKRGTTRTQDEMVADILAAAGKVMPRNWGCSACSYAIWKEAGKNYFNTLESLGGTIPEDEAKESLEVTIPEEDAKPAEEEVDLSKMNPLKRYWYLKRNGKQS